LIWIDSSAESICSRFQAACFEPMPQSVSYSQPVFASIQELSMDITVLGTGFAALTSIREIRRLMPSANITVIAPSAELIYLPSLIWIPARLRNAHDLRIPLNAFFARMRVKHLAAHVEDVQNDGRLVLSSQGEIRNDGLIIATGSRFIKKLPGIEHAITPCEGIEAAEKIRDRLDDMKGGTIAVGFAGNPEEPAAMRGGPMLEFLFGIDTLLRRQNRREHFELVFFNPADKPAQRLGERVPDAVLALMARQGIKTHLGHKIRGFEADKVVTEGGEISADLILFMPGITGPAWIQNSAIEKSSGGLIAANERCQVKGLSRTYVAGDSGSYPGPVWQAKQAHMADLQAVAASRNLVAELSGLPVRESFKHELICIIDTLSHGILIKRTEKRSVLLPPLRLMHYAKRIFERWYLRPYR
jgi:sulfide:quinone oxidoreductase